VTHFLPTLNAALNATSVALLLLGWFAIRANRLGLHIAAMLMACASSALFLISYLIYHAQVGHVPFPGRGWIRPLYFAILFSHTLLAILIVPLVLRTVYLAFRRRYEAHVHLARVTLPLWLYVSATGVVVFWLVYHSPWGISQ